MSAMHRQRSRCGGSRRSNPTPHGGVNMFQRSYPVLLVDDDPDVLSVSKLALRSMTIFGVPLNVSAASSKAEAVEMLGRRTTRLRGGGIAPFTVALIDVVMETDTAGLELCQYVRDTMKDKITQIY